MRFIIFHLLNDFSGSPKVLAEKINSLLAENHLIDLFTSKGGPLDNINHPNLKIHHIPYKFTNNHISTAFRFIYAQFLSLFAAIKYSFNDNCEFYINTILPIGAAAGALLRHKKITLHCHENVLAKGFIYQSFAKFMLHAADHIICVSNYQAQHLPQYAQHKLKIIPNALPKSFLSNISPNPDAAFNQQTILMVTSLKTYKGIPQFLNLASQLPQYKFSLVINETEQTINSWLLKHGLHKSENVTIHPRQTDVAPFYNKASILLNLSDPKLFIETFGMTALEAKACKIPAIVPTVGGIAELISDGINGYKIDCNDSDSLKNRIINLLSDKKLYLKIANGQQLR